MTISKTCLAAIAAVGLVVGVVVADDKKPREKGRVMETEDIMKRNHGKNNGLGPKITDLVKGGKLADALPLAKQFATAAGDLPKNKPEKGDKKSWDELAKEYATNAKDLVDALTMKDAAAAKSALSVLNGSCKACHDAHKGD